MFGIDSAWHWIVVLALALVFFGTGKLRHAGSDIGAAIRDFRKGVKGDVEDKPA
jgi:sec-independent protein translocase protein TatA